MIALGIFAVCINVQSFGDLVNLLTSSPSCGSDSAVLFKMGQHEKEVLVLHFCLLISMQQTKFWILRNWAKNDCFPDIGVCVYMHKCHIWRKASCIRGTISGLIFLHSWKDCLNIPGENSTCCTNKTCLCFCLESKKCWCQL